MSKYPSRALNIAQFLSRFAAFRLQLMDYTTERRCSDERDRIFALYSMVPAIQSIYPPDYTKPVKDVMLETTAYLVNYECGALMYRSFGLRDDRLSDKAYPS
ncbi:hypothetical protein CHU98_g5950 [Xylaria longipes]|nr:hypothetical protein CHU98_g5950 [Xylaria longipes]